MCVHCWGKRFSLDKCAQAQNISLYLFSGYIENLVKEMNFSAGESNFTVVLMQRDTFETALTKNIIVVALCLSINYINSMLVHTFTKHQVKQIHPLFSFLTLVDMFTYILYIFFYFSCNVLSIFCNSFQLG